MDCRHGSLARRVCGPPLAAGCHSLCRTRLEKVYADRSCFHPCLWRLGF
ncbi:hypothetical protein SZ55_3524 [Pseudomonas sp. FeS53a]|nr:hypothetical protein SZ55_3524 [Pseudomonas sp. FeS53a]